MSLWGSANRLGRDLASHRRINEIVHGKREITATTALRLSRYLELRGFWLGFSRYDLMWLQTLAERCRK